MRTSEIDGQKTVLQICSQHFHPLGEHETALKLPRCNAAMHIVARLVIVLASADDQLAFLHSHVELFACEPRDRKRDAQPLGLLVLAGNALDVIGRVAFGRLRHAVESTFDLVEPEQKRTGQRRYPGHGLKALKQATLKGTVSGLPGPAKQHAGRLLQIWGSRVNASRMLRNQGCSGPHAERRTPQSKVRGYGFRAHRSATLRAAPE